MRVYVHIRVRVYKCLNAELSGIQSVQYRNEKTNDAGTGPVPDHTKAVRHLFGPVPDWNYWCRNADAGVSFFDADAQLWFMLTRDRILKELSFKGQRVQQGLNRLQFLYMIERNLFNKL